MNNYQIGLLGFYIFLSVITCIYYKLFLRSGDSIFFKDKSDIEKKLREIQKIEIDNKLNKLKKDKKDEI